MTPTDLATAERAARQRIRVIGCLVRFAREGGPGVGPGSRDRPWVPWLGVANVRAAVGEWLAMNGGTEDG